MGGETGFKHSSRPCYDARDMNREPSGQAVLDERVLWRVATRTVLFTLAVLLLFWLAIVLREVVAQTLLALIISAGMTPIVDRLARPAPGTQLPPGQARRWVAPRALVVIVLYAILISVIVVVGSVIVPPVVNEVEDLGRRLPIYVVEFQEWLQSLPERYPFIPLSISQGLPDQLRSSATQLGGLLNQAAVVVGLLFGVLGGALNFVFILFLALYITSDASRIRRYLISFLPAERRIQADIVTAHMGDRLGGWVRGQLMLSLIIGSITLVGLWLIGVRYAVLLSVVAAIGEAVPMVGPIISAVPAVIVAFFQSPVQGILTLILYILVQQFENAVVVPKVMERAVALHPLAVMLALLIGGELFGVTGAILSVPVTAALAVVLEEVRRERESRREMRREIRQSGLQTPPDDLAAAGSSGIAVHRSHPAVEEEIPPDGPLDRRPEGQSPSRAPVDLPPGGRNQPQTDPGAHADHGSRGEYGHGGGA